MKHEMPIVSVEEITPDIARDMLSRNEQNRTLRLASAQAIARDILADDWQFNGDAIRINAHNQLVDGQHRLKACIIADRPIKTLVVRNLPTSANVTIDAGRARTNSDRLKMVGTKNHTHMSATIRILAGISANKPQVTLTGAEQKRIVETHPDLENSASRCRRAPLGFGSLMAATHYIIKSLDGDDVAENWISTWETGQQFYEGDALIALRQRIIRFMTSGAKLHQRQKVLFVCNAVNLWRKKAKRITASQAKEAKIEGWRGL